MKNVVGQPALDQDFFDREAEQNRLWSRLNSDNVLLLAPRRVGKTSLLHRLQARAEVHGYRVVFISVSDRTREIDFIERLYNAIQKAQGGAEAIKAVAKRLAARFPGISKVAVGPVSVEFTQAHPDEWLVMGDALVSTLRSLPDRWLILVDELPLFILTLLEDDRSRARTFLNWLREARIGPTDGPAIRWVLAGSIGLDTVTERERLGDTINDLKIEYLGPFTRPDADAMLQKLAASYGHVFSDDVRAHMLDRIGWLIPYHIQLLFSAVLDGGMVAPSPADVDAAYNRLLEPSNRSAFDYWVQRLGSELGKVDGEHALALLAAAAQADSVSREVLAQVLLARQVEDSQRLTWLLTVLESDGYLVREAGHFRFRSPLLRDYWRQRVLG